MILKIYTVYDSAVGAFMQPFFARSHGEALRNFQDAITDTKGPFKHAADVSLFHLGAFDDENGDIQKPLAPERLLDGREVIST